MGLVSANHKEKGKTNNPAYGIPFDLSKGADSIAKTKKTHEKCIFFVVVPAMVIYFVVVFDVLVS